ncbi:hypothetical protein Nepgr_025553 [Nepenthes gracilis]|uniref:Uncharacterized protein n=1 Tax=Nepenthes gracilis TaxID=150966 RepID=A0AAD3T697_NEPGR|nr:hypothetical protein Nepgr_025553 [Nepenthes gracilis]
MDPCSFVRIDVGKLALRFPQDQTLRDRQAFDICKITINGFPSQIADVPLIPPGTSSSRFKNEVQQGSASIGLRKSDLQKLAQKLGKRKKNLCLKIDVHSSGCSDGGGRGGIGCLGMRSRRFLGRVSIPLDLNERGEILSGGLQEGWFVIGKKKKTGCNAELHVRVKVNIESRFVFEFDGGSKGSPQVAQVQDNLRQPAFSCLFSDSHLKSSSSAQRPSAPRSWLRFLKRDREAASRGRKGWSITIHDLSGSAVAAASMVTPFVPMHGSDRVHPSNPGAWLILRPDAGIWIPWGRLDAWREPGSGGDSLGYRFSLLPDFSTAAADMASTGINLSNGAVSTKTGGRFGIDMGNRCGGFVMSSTVGGERKEGTWPTVEVGVQHVTQTKDAAVFLALAAAIDLSMEACKRFP